MSINSIIIDINHIRGAETKTLVSQMPFLNLMGIFTNVLDVPEYITENRIHLIIMDPEGQNIGTLEFLRSFDFKPYLIFIAENDRFAVKGFELGCTDFLLKPVTHGRFALAAERVLNQYRKDLLQSPGVNGTSRSEDGFIFIKTEFRYQKVNIADILYIKGQGDYLLIVTTCGKIMTLLNFANMINILPAWKFFRIHKSFIVPIDKISTIEKSHVLVNDLQIPIGDVYSAQFFELLKCRNLVTAGTSPKQAG
jgi:DNA-binding LytR/AlgR family response regulator